MCMCVYGCGCVDEDVYVCMYVCMEGWMDAWMDRGDRGEECSVV